MKTLTFVISILFMTACTKEGGNLYIEGRVYNPVTGEGVKGVTLHMFREKTFSGVPPGSKLVAEATTDANGYYKMSHTGGAWPYYVNINSGTGGYYLLGWANDNIGLEGKFRFQMPKGKNVVADYEMVPFGKLKFQIKNTNCVGAMDNIKIVYKGALIEDSEVLINDTIIDLDGCVDLIDEIWVSHPMGERYYEWVVTRNNITTIYQDTVQIGVAEEKIYEVFY